MSDDLSTRRHVRYARGYLGLEMLRQALTGRVTNGGQGVQHVPVVGRSDQDRVDVRPGHELIAPQDATIVRKFKAAGAIIVSIPVMVLFYILQKHLVAGLTAGSVKG